MLRIMPNINPEFDEDEDLDLSSVPKPGDRKLLFMRPLDETLADIVQWETNVHNPRHGLPVMYNLTLQDMSLQAGGTRGLDERTTRVHWTRVLHVVDKAESSDVIGVPRLRPVFNRLVDCRKLYGGSAEMYWAGAFPGISFETQPGVAPQAAELLPEDVTAIKEQLELYYHSLQRSLVSSGMQAKMLSPQVVDPTSQIKVQIEGICIELAVPMRIFMGSERGELASGQDKDSWDERIQFRQNNHVTPNIIAPLVDRLIVLEILPEPEEDGFIVEWPPLAEMSEEKRTNIALIKTDILSKYIQGGVDTIIEPLDFLVKILGFELEEAEDILENALEHIADANPEAGDDDIVAGRNPTPPQLEGVPGEGVPGKDPLQQGGKAPVPGAKPAPGKKVAAKGVPPKPAPAKKAVQPKPTGNKKTSKKAAKGGIWRTMDGGAKVYIQDGVVRAGGPAGPIVGGTGAVPAKKKTTSQIIDELVAKENAAKAAEEAVKTPPKKKKPAAAPPKEEKKEKTPSAVPGKEMSDEEIDQVREKSKELSETMIPGKSAYMEKGTELYERSGKKLTAAHKEALEFYSGEDGYDILNGSLRGTKQDADVALAVDPTIRLIQEAASHPLPEPTMVFRGVSPRTFERFSNSNEVVSEGFVSTSLDRSVAKGFSRKTGSIIDPYHLLEIVAKTGASITPVSQMPAEAEILQKHGVRYRVVGKRQETNKELVGNMRINIISNILTLEEI